MVKVLLPKHFLFEKWFTPALSLLLRLKFERNPWWSTKPDRVFVMTWQKNVLDIPYESFLSHTKLQIKEPVHFWRADSIVHAVLARRGRQSERRLLFKAFEWHFQSPLCTGVRFKLKQGDITGSIVIKEWKEHANKSDNAKLD